jgi:hypothetical protein
MQGTQGVIPPPQFTAINSSCGSSCTFTPGTAGSIGIATAVVSSGQSNPTWTLAFAGSDVNGVICDTHSTYWSINGSTGLFSSTASAVAGTYNLCRTATQAGVGGSPYTVAVPVSGSIQGIACAIGPNYMGPIPNPAAAMGYTTCLNFDFTYTGTFSNRVAFTNANNVNVPANQTYQWSNIGSWLNNANTGITNALLAGANATNGTAFSSSAYQIVQDNGTQVLLSQYIQGDGAPQINTPLFPLTNMFLEEEARVDPLAYANVTSELNTEIIDDFGFFRNKPGGTAGAEIDAGFNCGVSSPSGWANAGQSQACGGNGSFYLTPAGAYVGQPTYPPPSPILLSDGNYHTMAMLSVASRTNNRQATCGYYDHQWADGRGFGPCWAMGDDVGGQGTACTHTTNSAICWETGNVSIGTYVTGATATTGKQWIRRITIWTCAGWNTPAPSGNGYTADNNCDPGNLVFNATGGNQSGPSY